MANINKVALLNNGKVVGAGRNKDNSNLAPIEATTTASRSYLVGDYLMLQGEFYKVVSAIAIGDTLTVGTNIQSTTVGDAIVEVDEKFKTETISNIFTPDSGITVNTIDAYKIGNEIHLTLSVNASTAMTEGFIGSIASQYMPSGSTVPVAVGAGLARKTSMGAGTTYPLGCWLSTNSKIYIKNTTDCGGLALSMTWRI